MKSFLSVLALTTAVGSARAGFSSWDTKCGSRFDRLHTTKLSFTAAGGFAAGHTATIDMSGSTDLQGPLMGGSWSARVYEEGFSHPVGDFFGDLMKVITFPDPKNTTFSISDVDFPLPPSKASGKFQVSFTAMDFRKNSYYCIDIYYTLGNAEKAADVELAEVVTSLKQDPYTVTKQPGNFTLDTVTISTASGHFQASDQATVTATGVIKKQIVAGTVKYQVYQTGVRSFIASGSSSFFKCNNKGCDISQPIALKLSGNSGAPGTHFTLTFDLSLPTAFGSSSNDFKIVFWTEDQDHFPYDFSATIAYTLE